MASRVRIAIVLLVSVLAGLAAFRWTGGLARNAPPEILAAEFAKEVEQGHVSEIVVDEDWTGVTGVSSTRGRFRAKLPVDQALVARWRSGGITVKIERFSATP
jgi:hypothetical protein